MRSPLNARRRLWLGILSVGVLGMMLSGLLLALTGDDRTVRILGWAEVVVGLAVMPAWVAVWRAARRVGSWPGPRH
jgi:cytochrome b561